MIRSTLGPKPEIVLSDALNNDLLAAGADLVLLAVDEDVAVAVDLPVDLDGLPGTVTFVSGRHKRLRAELLDHAAPFESR